MRYLILLLLLASNARAVYYPDVGALSGQNNYYSLIGNVRTLTADISSPLPNFDNFQIIEFLNEAQQEILMGSHCLQQTMQFQLIPGTTYYPMPPNYTVIERVTVGSKSIPQMTPAALDSQSLGWENASGYPNRYFINFSSRDLVGFAPWPQFATDTDTVKIDYDVVADTITYPFAIPFGIGINPNLYPNQIPYNGVNEVAEYRHALAYWAASMIEQAEGKQALASSYMGVFTAVATQLRMKCRDLTNYRPSASGTP